MNESPEDLTERLTILEKKLVEEKKLNQEYLTRLKYLQADFENFKNRSEREINQVRAYSSERIILSLLDIVDELEIAIETAKKENCGQAIVGGVEMTLKKIRKLLEQEDVCVIDCKGKLFDPSQHNAIMVMEKNDVNGCVVMEEIRKGYIMKDKVIRPSIVKVAVNSSSNSKNKKGGN